MEIDASYCCGEWCKSILQNLMQFNVIQFDESHCCGDWCNTLLWSLVQVNVVEFDAIVKCKSICGVWPHVVGQASDSMTALT